VETSEEQSGTTRLWFCLVSYLGPDDTYRCVDRMRPQLQAIVNQGFKGEALIAAMNFIFARLLRDRGGSDEPLLRCTEDFTKLPSALRNKPCPATSSSKR